MKEIQLTQDKVALVDDEDFEWLNQFNWHAHEGQKTWYAMRMPGSRKLRKGILMHRLISNAQPGIEVDHRDGNGLHNWRDNLRLATHAQNLANRGKTIKNTSGYKGVVWDVARKKWQAQIHSSGKNIHLGRFVDIIDAARAYDAKVREIHGEFANLNFPDE